MKSQNNKEILEKKIEAINKELNRYFFTGIACIFIIVFVPILTFKNFKIQINLWTIIAFVGIITSISRSNNLRSRKEELLAELSVYKKVKPRITRQIKKKKNPGQANKG